MNSESKFIWFVVVAMLVFGALGFGIKSHNSHECRMTAIKTNMPTDQIQKVCN